MNRASRGELRLIGNAADLGGAWQSMLKQVALGRISILEGEALSVMLENRRRAIEAAELDARMRAIEERIK